MADEEYGVCECLGMDSYCEEEPLDIEKDNELFGVS